jgi:hypothetical protein
MKKWVLILFFLSCIFTSAIMAFRLNEVCSDNATVATDYLGRYSDWIEIKNTTSTTIDLSLYCLSDSPANLSKFRFPAGRTLAPGQIILVWAVNEATTIAPNGDICGTNFAISASGEPVILSLFSDGTIIDQMPSTAIPEDISFGRAGDDMSWYFFSQPTPGSENSSSVNTLEPPEASLPGGWYPDPVAVNFVSSQPNVQIRYTTDGNDPTILSPLWQGPLTLHNRSSEPNGISTISTVLPNLPEPVNELDWWFPPATLIPKIHTIKARCFATGALPSSVVTKSYLVGIDHYDFPVVSLTFDPDDLFDPDTGIFIAGNGYDGVFFETANFMQNWDVPLHTEWFNTNGNLVYQKECEAEIHGTYTARAGMKSLRLKTSGIDNDVLSYPFFGNDYLSSFRYLILRNSGNDVHKTLFRDAFVENLMGEQNLDVSNFTPYIVFINGEYWGIHNLQERMRENFVSEHYNIPVTELDVIEKNLDVNAGDSVDYSALLTYLEQNDETQPWVWQYLETKIDMRNLREYMAGQIYAGNTDWPGNNIRYWRKRVPYTPNAPYGHDGRWRWLVYDMDFSYGLYQNPYWTHDTLNRALSDSLGWRTFLLRNLIQNEGFKRDFLNTIADRLNYNWQPSRVIAMIDQYETLYETSMPLHIDRWQLPSSMAIWRGEVNALRTFAINRPDFLRNLVVNRFNLAGIANLNLQIQPPEAAAIRMNGNVNLTSGSYKYFQGIPISLKVVPNQNWALVSFNGSQSDSISIIPGADQTIILVMQSVENDDDVLPSPVAWNLLVYPNPYSISYSYLNLKLNTSVQQYYGNYQLRIYNVKGQQIGSYAISIDDMKRGEWRISIPEYRPGLYIVKLLEGKSVRAVKKFTVR